MHDLIDRSRGNLSPVALRREVAVRGALRHFAELTITAAALFLFVFVIPAVFGGL